MAGTLLKTLKFLKIAFDKLDILYTYEQLERLGITIDRAMSSEARSFHTAEHIFTLADVENPILLLAAIFHDIVYFTVDLGFIPEIEEIMKKYVNIRGMNISLKEDAPELSAGFYDILHLYNFELGCELPPFRGMNEFLSNVVLYHEFKDNMSRKLLIEISCCIELTIPFRGKNAEGLSPPEQLAARLASLNAQLPKEDTFTKKEITLAIQNAVQFANSDVLNFSSAETSAFLENTWKLLPETNPALRSSHIYTVRNYRIALQKIHAFLTSLDPQVVFICYKGVPNEFDFHYLNYRAQRNIMVAREYLGVKLLSIGILEAITRISGGDSPVALLMGDTSDEESLQNFEDMLGKTELPSEEFISQTVYVLLDEGRQQSISFDLNRSPLSRYVYARLGTRGIEDYSDSLHEMFNEGMSASAFLNALPAKLILPIVHACSEMSFTRKRALSEYYESRL